MIEKTVLDYLTGQLDVPVYMEEPEYPADSYVIIEKTSGGRSGELLTATMAVQSYGRTLLQAAGLNETVKEKMDKIADQNPISRARLNSDYNYTDTATRRYRYQAVFDFIYYQEV